MKRRAFLRAAGSSVLALVTGSCGRSTGYVKDPNVDYFTCTMHPSVKSPVPSKCPICSMDLVPVMKKGATPAEHAGEKGMPAQGDEMGEFSVPVERQQQIGVTYAKVEKKPLRSVIRAVGVVAPDRTRQWSFVARVEGYVEKLHITSPGEPVAEGAPLLTIYSPELLTAEREFVNLLQTRDATGAGGHASGDRLVEAARRRLEQWNITAAQLAQLEKSRQPSELLTLNSPFQGVVQEVQVEQGRKVMSGDPLVTVVDLRSVWVWAEFFENELSLIEKGAQVRLSAQAYPGESFSGVVGLIDPFVNPLRRTAKVRVDIANTDLRLRPGMYVDAELARELPPALTIPISAALPTGNRTLVFVDKGDGRITPRAVQLGGKFGEVYEVRSGLEEGERVIASANFLIDAEAKVQGAVKDFERVSE
jgi:Cu(I)/Ag(I) efflux system membrane fusion protein